MDEDGFLLPGGLTVPLLLQHQVLLQVPSLQMHDVVLCGLLQVPDQLHQMGVGAQVSKALAPQLATGLVEGDSYSGFLLWSQQAGWNLMFV